MKKAVVTIGISASGKSTWARDYCARNCGAVEINRDQIRKLVFENRTKRPFVWNEWKFEWEDDITKIHRRLIEEAASNPFVTSVVISDTNLNHDRNDELKTWLESLGFKVEFKIFKISFEEAIMRDASRPNSVGSDVIAKQYKKFKKLEKFLKGDAEKGN
jgi:predicted kinase